MVPHTHVSYMSPFFSTTLLRLKVEHKCAFLHARQHSCCTWSLADSNLSRGEELWRVPHTRLFRGSTTYDTINARMRRKEDGTIAQRHTSVLLHLARPGKSRPLKADSAQLEPGRTRERAAANYHVLAIRSKAQKNPACFLACASILSGGLRGKRRNG